MTMQKAQMDAQNEAPSPLDCGHGGGLTRRRLV